MMVDPLRHYRQIWMADFEYRCPPGDVPDVHCMVARESRSGRWIRVWSDQLAELRQPPFPIDPDSLFVAYYSSAEFGCFRQLGWPMPVRILDLFCEFRCLTNGLSVPCGNGLLGALAYYGLGAIAAAEKTEMRDLAIRGEPFTPAERQALIAYCGTDVDSLARLLPAMLPEIDLPRALLRGRYMAAVASMEHVGTPIDTTTLESLRTHWGRLKGRLIREIDKDYGVFIPGPKYRSDQAQAAKHARASQKEAAEEILAAERAARRVTGLTVTAIQRWENAGKDYSSWPGLDVAARELASEYPCLGLGRGYSSDDTYDDTDHAALLWDRLREKSEPFILETSQRMNDAPAELSDDTPMSFSTERFENWLIMAGISWPRLSTGALALDDDTFREMAKAHARVAPLRELRHTLGEMRLFEDLAVGPDGRNRCLLSPFRARSSRNQPSNAKFIFGPSCWLRSLIQPAPGRAVAYVDWSQQEFGIAAALSGDPAMMDAYASGDPYLRFAIQAGAVPPDATKASHPAERELFKTCALGVAYGMMADSLARRIEQPPCVARELLRLHRETYPKFWRWSEAAVDHAMLHGTLQTVFGWTIHVGAGANPRSLANFPMQGNGGDMLRLACCLATERGIRVCAPVHDAVLVEGPTNDIHRVVAETQAAMAEASRVVLSGFELRSDAKIVCHPDRYSDPRGLHMWQTMIGILRDLESEREDEVWQDHPF